GGRRLRVLAGAVKSVRQLLKGLGPQRGGSGRAIGFKQRKASAKGWLGLAGLPNQAINLPDQQIQLRPRLRLFNQFGFQATRGLDQYISQHGCVAALRDQRVDAQQRLLKKRRQFAGPGSLHLGGLLSGGGAKKSERRSHNSRDERRADADSAQSARPMA